MHLEEYRFQVNLNAQRSNQFLTLNTAITSIGAGLGRLAREGGSLLVAAVFLAGLFTAFLAILASKTQHTYYRAARDGIIRVGKQLKLADVAVSTTPGMGATQRQKIRVVTAYNWVYGLFAIIDALAFIYYTISSLGGNAVIRVLCSVAIGWHWDSNWCG